METKGQACGGLDEAAEVLLEYRGKLGSWIQDHIRWEAMKRKHVLQN